MRKGHVVSEWVKLRTVEAKVEASEDGRGVVVLKDAVAPACSTAVSFVDWVHAGVGTLQRSRQSVHLRRDAPIAGISRLHCLVEPCLLRNELPCVE